MKLAEDLKARGYAEHSSAPLETIVESTRGIYLGMDPTADSLHVGHLVPLILMKRLGDAGHRTVFLVGGGTGMIGDPRETGERTLLDKKTLEHNKKALKAQLQKLIGKKIEMVDNATWLSKTGLLEFLRDTGKHFTVNELTKRDLIRRRLDSGDPISFTEFTYSLLQGFDFLHLFKKKGIEVQVGGTDQWTNLLSGVELIRKKLGREAFCFTLPLVTDANGKKFGKSEGNAVWLDGKKTPPYAMYQFWINLPDQGLETYLKLYTFMSVDEISALMTRHAEHPAEREAQKTLAREVTRFVHGEKGMLQAESETEARFSDKTLGTLSEIERAAFPTVMVSGDQTMISSVVADGFKVSKSEARRLIQGRGVRINGETVEADRAITDTDLVGGEAFLEKGKVKIIVKK
jgi:tyrosyl-tRNA synthetase